MQSTDLKVVEYEPNSWILSHYTFKSNFNNIVIIIMV